MQTYIGRFAPSPTGDLHLGSLAAALASFLDAKAHHGKWLVRIEDIDPPRCVEGSAQRILDGLRFHGLHWDGDVLFQSTRLDAYHAALQELIAHDVLFSCQCSRSLLEHTPIYPGTCRNRLSLAATDAWRVRVTDNTIDCEDRIQKMHSYRMTKEVGDFVVRRRDGLIAYQLAVIVDDAFQHITDVVRGVDLLDSTPKQRHLQDILRLPHVRYAHIPLVTTADHTKLSKQNLAPPLDNRKPLANLRLALKHLNQPLPEQMAFNAPEDLLTWAYQHWDLKRMAWHQ